LKKIKNKKEINAKFYHFFFLEMLKAAVKNGQYKKAVEMFNAIEHPIVDDFNQMIRIATNKEEADKYFEYLVNCNFPNEMTLSFLMNSYVKYLHPDKLPQELERLCTLMESTYQIKPNRVHFGIIVHAFIKIKNMDSAQEVFDTMCKNKIDPDYISFDILIRGYIAVKNIEKGKQVYQQMRDLGITQRQSAIDYYILHKII
jgi:pentatricopeptide repeat protein